MTIDEIQYPTLGVDLVLDDGGVKGMTVQLRHGGKVRVRWKVDAKHARRFYADVHNTMTILEALEKIRKASH
jgi:hypothetical protein